MSSSNWYSLSSFSWRDNGSANREGVLKPSETSTNHLKEPPGAIQGRFDLGGYVVDYSVVQHEGSSYADLLVIGADGQIRY